MTGVQTCALPISLFICANYLPRNFTGIDKNNMGVFLLISKAEKRVQSVIYIQDAHKTERTTFEEEKRKKLTEQE